MKIAVAGIFVYDPVAAVETIFKFFNKKYLIDADKFTTHDPVGHSSNVNLLPFG